MRADSRSLGLTVPVSEVLDPVAWRERYAWGVPLGGTGTGKSLVAAVKEASATGGKGAADEVQRLLGTIPDHVIRWHLRAALSELELKLGVPMAIEVVKSTPVDDGLVKGTHYDREIPRLPYTKGMAGMWFRIDVPGPVISVERVRAYYYGTLIWELSPDRNNAENLRLTHPRQGTIHLLPINMQSIMVDQNGNYGVWYTLNMHRSPVPDFWAVDFTRGPVSRNGEPGQIEAVLAHWCYCVAGITLLNIGGLAMTKGLTNTSVSFDGVSRSIGLQASAMYGVNSCLEHVYDETNKRIDWKAMRASKRGLRVIPMTS